MSIEYSVWTKLQHRRQEFDPKIHVLWYLHQHENASNRSQIPRVIIHASQSCLVFSLLVSNFCMIRRLVSTLSTSKILRHPRFINLPEIAFVNPDVNYLKVKQIFISLILATTVTQWPPLLGIQQFCGRRCLDWNRKVDNSASDRNYRRYIR